MTCPKVKPIAKRRMTMLYDKDGANIGTDSLDDSIMTSAIGLIDSAGNSTL